MEVLAISDEQITNTQDEILNELKTIREHLTKEKAEEIEEEPEKDTKKKPIRSFGKSFVEFIKKYKVLGLAVAFIMATYAGILVQALVDDLIMPIFTYIPGLNELANLNNWTVGPFFIGHFISTTVTFVIISFVIFIIIKISTRLGIEAEN